MANDPHEFERFMKERESAASAYVRGDAASLGRIVARASPATFFGPKGGYVQGPTQVYESYERDAKHFASGDSRFEILHMAASDDVAYWTGFQRANVQLASNAETVQFDLRVTEVFRREDDEWKLVHRHADPQTSESKDAKK